MSEVVRDPGMRRFRYKPMYRVAPTADFKWCIVREEYRMMNGKLCIYKVTTLITIVSSDYLHNLVPLVEELQEQANTWFYHRVSEQENASLPDTPDAG